jgi:erythromycin esterase
MEKRTTQVHGEIIGGLKRHATSFTTVQPHGGFDDLMHLKQLIGGSRIVALGEASHGTREFFLMKHRLLEFLVKEMDFNVFAIEASWAESNLINEYVHTGEGDPTKLLAGLHFWTWNTQEVLDMILWMRSHNQDPGNAPFISFRGFDMQSSSMAIDNVIAYLHKVSPEAEEEVKAIYAPFRPYADDEDSYGELPLETKSQCRLNVQHVYELLQEHRAIYEAASSSEKFAHALQSARIVLQAEKVFTGGPRQRDVYMAENASWLLEQAGSKSKIALWAHNGHVSKNEENMGAYLHKSYDDAMVTFGFSFYQGSLNAIDSRHTSKSRDMLISHKVPPPPKGSYEHVLDEVGLPRMFLNLRNVPADSAVAAWLAGPHLCRSIGAAYDVSLARKSFYSTHLLDEYDVIIYLKDTTPSTLLPNADRRKKMSMVPGKARNLNFKEGWVGWNMMGSRPQDYERNIEQDDVGDVCVSFASKVDESPSTAADPQTIDVDDVDDVDEDDELEGFGAFAQTVDADMYRGKRVQMVAHMKSEEVEQWAGLWMRVDGPRCEVHSFDNMQDRAIKGNSDWTRCEIALPVKMDSRDVFFGILLVGKGKVWLRGVQISVME